MRQGQTRDVGVLPGRLKIRLHDWLVGGNLAGPLVRGGKSYPPLKCQLKENE